jgi:hypothetical protein
MQIGAPGAKPAPEGAAAAAAALGISEPGAADPSEILQEILEIIQQPNPCGMEGGALCEVVDGFLFLSGLDDADNGDALEAAGITAVVNCASGEAPAGERGYSALTATLELDAKDAQDYPILAEHLDAYCAFLEAARAQGGVVLTHCVSGVNRSAALLVGYMVRVLRWPLRAGGGGQGLRAAAGGAQQRGLYPAAGRPGGYRGPTSRPRPAG